MENILTQLISWCLVANVVSGIIVMYMSITMRSDLLQEKILAGAAVVMAVHSLHALIVATFFPAWLIWTGPHRMAWLTDPCCILPSGQPRAIVSLAGVSILCMLRRSSSTMCCILFGSAGAAYDLIC